MTSTIIIHISMRHSDEVLHREVLWPRLARFYVKMTWSGRLAANDVANSQRTVNKADPGKGGVADDQLS